MRAPSCLMTRFIRVGLINIYTSLGKCESNLCVYLCLYFWLSDLCFVSLLYQSHELEFLVNDLPFPFYFLDFRTKMKMGF